MKRYYILLALLLALLGCDDTPPYIMYSVGTQEYVSPDDADKYKQCMADVMKAASNQLTTSDYEDMDDSIDSAYEKCIIPYKRTRFVLFRQCYSPTGGGHYSHIPPEEMTDSEKTIFNEIRSGNRTTYTIYPDPKRR